MGATAWFVGRHQTRRRGEQHLMRICYKLVCFVCGHGFNPMLEMRRDPGNLISGLGLTSGHETLGTLFDYSVDQFYPG